MSFIYAQTQLSEGEWSVYYLGRAPSIHCLDLNKQQEWKEKKKTRRKRKERKKKGISIS
jgi:hypothetical protein